MNWTAEDGYAELQTQLTVLKAFPVESSEANTRLQIIDTFLFDVLDWEKAEVDAERYCRDTGYADYAFLDAGSICFVLEAKKSGDSFLLKDGKFKCEPVSFGLLAQECPSARIALNQALGYAANLGARYIAITNGHQWLFTLTFIPNQKVEERLVYVFDSIDSIVENFRKFWNCFSKKGITSNQVCDKLLESRQKPAPSKMSRSIPGYPTPSARNVYVNELSYILKTVWDVLAKIEHTLKFLENCYVETKSDKHLISYANNILSRRLSADTLYFNAKAEDVSSISQVLAGSSSEKPFVVLGDVGHGKTTFLRYLRHVAAKEILKNYIQIEVDFLDRPDTEKDVAKYIYGQVEKRLLDDHGIDIFSDSFVKGVLYTDFKRFKESARFKLFDGDLEAQKREERSFLEERLSDKHSFFASVIRHLKRGHKQSVAIYFDNLDRRSAAIQEEAYLKASAIARDWECITFICLRPQTFHDSFKRGLLDSLAPKTFTIGSPDLALVLKRRFEFARKIALGEEHSDSFQQLFQDESITLKLPSVSEIFASCEFSVRKGANAIAMLSALSNGDIRLLIDLTRHVLSSGYLDTRKIINVIRDNGSYSVPDFEAVKTLLFGDYEQFNPSSSIFVNVFDIFHSDEKEHFIRCLALDYLNRLDHADQGGDYVKFSDLASFLESLYFDPATIKRHLEALRAAKCIDTIPSSDEKGEDRVRILTRGRYHIGGLVRTFQYWDAVIIDTPILDHSIRDKAMGTEDIYKRIDRTQAFINYLAKCAKSLHDAAAQETCDQIIALGTSSIQRVRSNLTTLEQKYRDMKPRVALDH